MLQAEQVIACARAYRGVRFAHQGRSHSGLDCLGLLVVVAQDLGLQFEGESAAALDVVQYGARPDTQLLQCKLATYLRSIDTAELQTGDVVLLRIDDAPQHLALLSDYPIAGELGMIHAYAPARKVIEHRYEASWRVATAAAYRLPQLVKT